MFDILLVAICTSRILALCSLKMHTPRIIGVLQLSVLVLGYEHHHFRYTSDVKKRPLTNSPFMELSNSHLKMTRQPEDRPKDVAVNKIQQKLSPEAVLFGTYK